MMIFLMRMVMVTVMMTIIIIYDDGDGDDIKGLETGLLVELEEVS